MSCALNVMLLSHLEQIPQIHIVVLHLQIQLTSFFELRLLDLGLLLFRLT